MSDSEAERAATRRGLTADKLFGWCNLRREFPGQLLARGQSWSETFARYDANNPATAETIPAVAETILPELQRPCPKCHAAIGEKCRNYKSQVMFTHPARLEVNPAYTEPRLVQRGLFD